MSQSPELDSKGTEDEHNQGKVRTLEPPAVTQIRLAGIQQLQAEIAQKREDITTSRRIVEAKERNYRKQWAELRRDLVRGARVEEGPLAAFLRSAGRGKKRRVTLIVK